MNFNSLLIKQINLNGRVCNIMVENGLITEIGPRDHICDTTLQMHGEVVLPALIDPHVHVRDLGQKDKEDWISASKAALAGGITTIFDMPNTIPATENLATLQLKREAAAKSLVRFKIYLGANNTNLEQLREVLETQPDDVCGIKIFLAASSSNDVLFQRDKLAEIFKLAKEYNTVATVHTELQHILDQYKAQYPDPTILDHNRLRNREAAIRGTELCLELASEIGNKLYIAHVSTAEEIQLIRKYKPDYPIYCEVTPHHLTLNEDILSKVENYGKVNPPLRTAKDNEALWQGINDGIIDTVGTDHAPHLLVEKNRVYAEAPSGFPGLETSLSVLNTARLQGYLDWEKLIDLTSRNIAQIFNINNAGVIEIGKPADLVIFDPDQHWVVEPENFRTKARYSPWIGQRLKGVVRYTLMNGNVKYKGAENDK